MLPFKQFEFGPHYLEIDGQLINRPEYLSYIQWTEFCRYVDDIQRGETPDKVIAEREAELIKDLDEDHGYDEAMEIVEKRVHHLITRMSNKLEAMSIHPDEIEVICEMIEGITD